jgi:hypothetical protein
VVDDEEDEEGAACILEDADGVVADDDEVAEAEDGLVEEVNELKSLAIRPREGSGTGAGVLGVSEAVSATTADTAGLGVADSDNSDDCEDNTRVEAEEEDNDDKASSGVNEFTSPLFGEVNEAETEAEAEIARRRAACKRCVCAGEINDAVTRNNSPPLVNGRPASSRQMMEKLRNLYTKCH